MRLKWICFISIAICISTVHVDAIRILPRLCCFHGECCPETWIPGNSNVSGLSRSLQDNIYGQHIVLQAVKRHIKAHMIDENPSKALSLSLHGGAGTGKTTTSSIIAQSIYDKGTKSQFVHFLFSTTVFSHKIDIGQYKGELKELIETSVNNCERSMFIFDEVDAMPPGLIDTIKPYINSHDHRNGINYRKAIFIFISNTAGTEILHQTLHFYHEGKDRDSIELKDVEKLVATAAANSETSGFYQSEILLRHIITAYVPFLPLEKKHIRQCIKDFLLKKKYYTKRSSIKKKKVREIANQLQYFPEDEQIFSTTGCKRIPDKAVFVMED